MAEQIQGLDKYREGFNKARELAARAHGEQKYGKYPYTYHLKKVEEALRRFGYDPDSAEDEDHVALSWDLVTAAWLHDVIEDTQVTRSEISQQFNHRVASLVWAVTNPVGGNRAWRASKVYPKIINTPYALILKLADRIANVEASVETKSGLINMYAKEWDAFQSKYRIKGEHDDMWKYIDRLIRENRKTKFSNRGSDGAHRNYKRRSRS
jgi:(p)ppGpp synthase/HD superfamily hydrolase